MIYNIYIKYILFGGLFMSSSAVAFPLPGEPPAAQNELFQEFARVTISPELSPLDQYVASLFQTTLDRELQNRPQGAYVAPAQISLAQIVTQYSGPDQNTLNALCQYPISDTIPHERLSRFSQDVRKTRWINIASTTCS